MSRPSLRAIAAAAAALAITTVVLTWPLFRHPGTRVLAADSLYGGAEFLVQRDINLTMWALAWDTHALVTDPLHLFHANAFYPARWTLALSEHMLGNVPLFSPVYLATGNPVLAHQTALLLSFVVAGLAMAAYVFYWTEDGGAALAAGFLFAFAPFRFWQIGNLHVISIHWLPLVTLGVDGILDGRLGRTGPLMLFAALVLSSFCSYYIGYAAFVLAGVYAAAGLLARGRASFARIPRLAVALGAAGVAVAVVTIPYVILQRGGTIPNYGQKGFTGLGFLGMLKFGVSGLLSFYVLPRRDGIPEFLTFTGIALAALALVVRRGHPRGALVVAGATGALLGLGPYILLAGGHNIPLPYRVLVSIVPGFSAMRVPHRFGALATLATMALAGLALAAVRRWLAARGRPRIATLVTLLAVAGVLVESTPRGLRAAPQPTGASVPAVYRWLAERGEGGPLLELPARPWNLYRESTFMYLSTFHWLPLVNGYTPYPPVTYGALMEPAKRLPAPEALSAVLAQVRLRWIVLHRHDVPPLQQPAWNATLGSRLRHVADFGDDVLYEVP